MTRQGPKMIDAAEIVTRNPGVAKLAVARLVGPNGSTRYGYEIVDRAIKAGMIQARIAGNRYQLFPADWDMSEIAR
jgi:hypothetical protein